MTKFRVLRSASYRLDEIYDYTKKTWGVDQADKYINGLFDFFEEIATRKILWRQIPVSYEVDGFYARYEHHYVYWKLLSSNQVGITVILHEWIDQVSRLQEDFEREM